MAALSYKSGLAQYRRYVEAVQERPILQASLFLVLSLMLLIMLIASALRPTLITIAGLVGQLGEQKTIVQRLDAKIAALAASQQNYQQFQSKLVLLDQAIPTSAQFAAWSQIAESLATTQGLEVVSVTLSQVPIATTQPPGLAKYQFGLTLRGDYAQLRQFLQSVENTRRIATLESVQLTHPTQSADTRLQLVVRGSLTLSLTSPKKTQ